MAALNDSMFWYRCYFPKWQKLSAKTVKNSWDFHSSLHLIKFSRRSSMHLKVVTPLIHYLGEKDSVSSGNHIKMPNFIFQSLISHHRSWRSYSIINFFLRIIHYVKYSKTAKHFRHSPGLMMELVEKVNYLVQTRHYSQFYLNLIKGNFKLIAFKYHCYCAKVSIAVI